MQGVLNADFVEQLLAASYSVWSVMTADCHTLIEVVSVVSVYSATNEYYAMLFSIHSFGHVCVWWCSTGYCYGLLCGAATDGALAVGPSHSTPFWPTLLV